MSTLLRPQTTGTPRSTVVHLVPQRAVHHEQAEIQGTLALDLEGAAAPPPPPEVTEFDPAQSARTPDPDAGLRDWVARLAQAVIETAAGHRPASQLVRWTTPAVHRELVARHRVMGTISSAPSRRLRPAVRSIHLCRPRPDALEASVHVGYGVRSRAVALRLEQRDGRWICVAAEFA